MKKTIMFLTLMISSFIFSSTLKDGRYAVSSVSKGKTVNMSIIVKKSKIISIDFDKKTEEGISYSLTPAGKDFREKKTAISREIVRHNSIDGIVINFDSITNIEFKKLYKFLIEKSEKGETGAYEL
ncbi:hypothetical protein [Caviibacter abscessus]|uniref:hypothetical protein n=1 Tax=Caviibacter abscessus TaxID=1766719 RepID=UPI000836A84D|nr:hypothetical protein [Caviibacter abscessus]